MALMYSPTFCCALGVFKAFIPKKSAKASTIRCHKFFLVPASVYDASSLAKSGLPINSDTNSSKDVDP